MVEVMNGFRWHEESGLVEHGVRQSNVLTAYFLAAACVFEPERAAERLAWARTAIVADAISSYFRSESCSNEMRQGFIHDFLHSPTRCVTHHRKKIMRTNYPIAVLVVARVTCHVFT